MNFNDLSFHRQGGWRSQFYRLQRWHTRVKFLGAGVSPDEQDVFYAFFQNCFTLKDWLKNSGAAGAADLNAFVDSYKEISACRDLANGTKHYNVTAASIDPGFFICREYVSPDSPTARSGSNSRPILCAGGIQWDLFDLVDRCMELWIEFLTSRHLLSDNR
jgi:hypothetical protein